MFDLGFWELCFVAVIALIVLGPERLPVAARTLGRWVGRARSYTRSLSDELNREANVRELRARMAESEREFKAKMAEVESGARDLEKEVKAVPGDAAQDKPPADTDAPNSEAGASQSAVGTTRSARPDDAT